MTTITALACIGAISLFVVTATGIVRGMSGIADRRRASRMAGRIGNWPTIRSAPQPLRHDRLELPILVLIGLVAGLLGWTCEAHASPPRSTEIEQHAAQPPRIEVHFSPNGGCTTAAVGLIASARGSVRLAGYQFTSEPIAKALIVARDHGRDVQVIVDRSSDRSKPVASLRASGVKVFVDAKHHIFHNKFIVADDAVMTGSFNFTESAERANAENCVTIRDAETAKLFSANWLGHSAHAVGGGS